MPAASTYTQQISALQEKISEQQSKIETIQSDPKYIILNQDIPKWRAGKLGAIRDPNNPSQVEIPGFGNFSKYVSWYDNKNNEIKIAQSLIDSYNSQITNLQTSAKNDPIVQNESKQSMAQITAEKEKELTKLNFAQKNTQYIIIGAIVLAVLGTILLIRRKP
jgi:hypothetical protein